MTASTRQGTRQSAASVARLRRARGSYGDTIDRAGGRVDWRKATPGAARKCLRALADLVDPRTRPTFWRAARQQGPLARPAFSMDLP